MFWLNLIFFSFKFFCLLSEITLLFLIFITRKMTKIQKFWNIKRKTFSAISNLKLGLIHFFSDCIQLRENSIYFLEPNILRITPNYQFSIWFSLFFNQYVRWQAHPILYNLHRNCCQLWPCFCLRLMVNIYCFHCSDFVSLNIRSGPTQWVAPPPAKLSTSITNQPCNPTPKN